MAALSPASKVRLVPIERSIYHEREQLTICTASDSQSPGFRNTTNKLLQMSLEAASSSAHPAVCRQSRRSKSRPYNPQRRLEKLYEQHNNNTPYMHHLTYPNPQMPAKQPYQAAKLTPYKKPPGKPRAAKPLKKSACR